MELIKGVNDFIREGGWLAVLLLVLFANHQQWWVMGTTFKLVTSLYLQRAENAEKERDDWKEIAKGYAEVAEVSVTGKKVRK